MKPPQQCSFRAVTFGTVLLATGLRAFALEYPYAPGELNRIQAVIETFGGSVSKTTTNALAPNASLEITDSTFPLTGQSIRLQYDGQPPVQPILAGTLRFNFPAVTPERDISGVFQPPMPASVTFDGSWTKGDFNYPGGEAYSYSAAQVLLTSIQPTGCPNTATARVRTGAPVPVGVNPVSVSASCDMKSLTSLGGSDPTEAEHVATGVLQLIAGDGGAGENPIFASVGATVTYYAVYRSRRKPEMQIANQPLVFAHTDGQPLPAARTLVLTNTGGLTLNWTAKATNNSPTSTGTPAWLKISKTSGTLDSLATEPIEFSVDTTGLAAGSYSATVTIEGNTWNGSKTISVALNFTGVPRLNVTPASFEFFNTVALPQQTLTLTNEGTLRLIPELVVTSDANWLDAPRWIGSVEPGQINVVTLRALQFPPPNFTQLAPGDYTGQILIRPDPNQAAQFSFPPVTVPLVFHVLVPKDELAILAGSVTPSTNEPIQLNTEYANFKADVTYQLGTRTDADLALRLFDEEGNLQASSDFVRVYRSDGLVASRRLTIPKFKITPDALGKAPEKLILRAVLLDRSLLTAIRITPETDYVYQVEPAIKLTLGRGTKVEDFQAELPAVVYADSSYLAQAGWPPSAVVDLPKSGGIRVVNVTARLFRKPGLNRFYTSRNTPVPAGFEGRVFLDLHDLGLLRLPIECMNHRADFVQFRANVVSVDTATVYETPQIDLPVERINLIAADPPFGTILPRSEPNKVKLTAEYNVPNFGRRIIEELTDPGGECVGLNHLSSKIKDEVLGPGRGQFTYEVTAFFPIISAAQTKFKASVLLRQFDDHDGVLARDCVDSHSFNLSDRLTLPTAPNQTVTAADATVKIITNPSAGSVDVAAPRKNLAAVAADNSKAGAAVARSLPPARVSPQRQVNDPLDLADIISVNQVWSFDPAIPAGAGFSADLSLKWTPEVVPDDPNFTEAALQVISLNPATGALRGYETTVDVTTRTATARIDSLENYYTLAVVGPFAQHVVNLPLLTGPSGLASRIHVSAGSQATGLSLTAIDGAGQTLTGEGNPQAGFVAAGASSSLNIPAVFGIQLPTPDAWMQGVVKADAAALLRLEQTNAADFLAAPRAFPRLLLPGLEHDASRSTELRLANPTRFDTSVSLELRNDDGTSAGSFNGFLGARNTLAGSLGEFFPGLPASFTGYVIAQAATDLVAVALVQSASALAIIQGQPLGLAMPPRLVAPAFATGGANHRARLALANASSRTAAVTLRLVGDTGANLAAPLAVNLNAGQQYRTELGAAFGLNAATPVEGSLVVEGGGGALIGELTSFDSGGQDLFRTSQPLLDAPATRHAFAHFDNASGRFTTLSLHNANATPAAVSVSALRVDGSTIGSAALLLTGGARATRKLAELIPGSAGLAGGSLVIESAEPVYASALTGEDSLNSLAAIPALTGEAVAPTEPPGPLKADYQFGDTLTSLVAGAPPLGPIGEGGGFATETVDGVARPVWRFPQGVGLSLPAFTDLVPGNACSIVVLFRFESVSGYRRLLDFKNGVGEPGCYVRQGALFFYLFNSVGGDATILPNDWAQVVVTRAADGTVTGYLNGARQFSFKDDAAVMLPDAANVLRFFKDNGNEESAGAVARIRLYDRALNDAEVTALDRLPRPPGPFSLTATLAAGNIVLSWPADGTGFVLQANSDLGSPAGWSDLGTAPTANNGVNSVPITATGSAMFFRLRRNP